MAKPIIIRPIVGSRRKGHFSSRRSGRFSSRKSGRRIPKGVIHVLCFESFRAQRAMPRGSSKNPHNFRSGLQ